MNLSELIPIVISLSIGIERLLEVAWEVVEANVASLKQRKTDNPTEYASFKIRILIPAGMLIGALLGGFSYVFEIQIGIENLTPATRIAIGLLAGASAPYAHQLIELLYKSQKLMQVSRDTALAGTTINAAVAVPTPQGIQTVAATAEIMPNIEANGSGGLPPGSR